MTQYAYDTTFLDYTTSLSLATARRITALVREGISVHSVLDVGCAQGAWLSAWRDAGVADLTGLDGPYVNRDRLLIERQQFHPHDLAKPFALGRRFDLAQSLEVAEHLPASRAEGFVRDLTAHADVVLFSAAPPGQGGENHVNEQPYEHWRDLFAAHGYRAFDAIRPALQGDYSVPAWYRYNLFLYVHEARVAELPPALRAQEIPATASMRDVSPMVYRARKAVVRKLPYWATQALARATARLRSPKG